MKCKLVSISCIALLSAFSTFTSVAQPGSPYLGVQAGYGGIQMPTISEGGMKTERYNGVALGVDGGYLFNINQKFKVGPEVGYKSYGDNTYKLSTISYTYCGHYFDILANAHYYFNANWHLIGKIGAAVVKQVETDDLGSSKGIKENIALLPEVVLGVGYNFNAQMGINISYNAVIGSSIPAESVGGLSNRKVASVNTAMLGFTYSFA